MSIATIALSSKGQIVIPKEIRDELQWDTGTELTIMSSPTGVTIKALPKASGRSLLDLIGMLRHDGPPLSTVALCEPVDYRADEGKPESEGP